MSERVWGLLTALACALTGAAVAVAVMLAHPPMGRGGEDFHAWLLDHPEAITEAMDRLQEKQTASLVSANRDAITTAFAGATAGNARGDVTLTEYYDYACGFCRQTVGDIDRLVATDPKLRVVFKEVALLSPLSDQAARLGLAAAKAGRFGAYHHALFNAGELSEGSMAAAARAAGVPFAAADAPDIAREMQDNMDTVRALHITGTPSFVIGDQLISGAVGFDQLKAAVAEARSGKAA
jgi:protein-disulfide isomerase